MLQLILNSNINYYIQNTIMYLPFLNIIFMNYTKVEPLVISNYWTYRINFIYSFIFIMLDTIIIKKINKKNFKY
ncbi:hypothetical protein STAIW_v1c06100 [Spiroplasma taiwanense CT-1]|uniref:Uncharacterized protein n=1 Tax=Spiroplasma taiwanense CT-1 TaxID=1276220 RepID=S5LZT9_9MOLU|nr:hypothetical protein STAIW_v1c06100 [Spiroplasma taiwanense CT-1]